jgi:hypothetical protein
MKYNIGFVDLFVRFVVGLTLIIMKFIGELPSGEWGAVLLLTGLILVGTAALGKCPIYHVLGLSSKRKPS